jgi:hypothetical protein
MIMQSLYVRYFLLLYAYLSNQDVFLVSEMSFTVLQYALIYHCAIYSCYKVPVPSLEAEMLVATNRFN